jgi:hypothetical protein
MSIADGLDEDDDSLSERIRELENRAMEPIEGAAYRRLLTGLVELIEPEAESTELNAVEKVDHIVGRFEELENTVQDLQEDVQRLEQRIEEAGGKEQKVAKIVEYADNRRGNEPVVVLTAKEIKGAAGISRRYAYDLMDHDDGLPTEYDWILAKEGLKQYGSLEIDKDDDARRIGIDFEGVHSAGVPLNKFTTQSGGEGVEN